jgi:hypothetical protein
VRALVLELVEGGTLADRIARGPLPLKDALAVVRQIVVELEDAPTAERVSPSGSTDAKRHRWTWLLGAAAAVLAALAVLVFAAGSGRFGSALDTSSYRFTPLAAEPAEETSPSWSPDGKSIVYVADVGGVSQLFTRSLDSAISTPITKSSTDCLKPFWSPDGARVYFISGGRGQLWSVGAAGGEPQLVLDDVAAAAVAPDGEALAFLRGPGGRRSRITGTPTAIRG